MSQLPQIKPKDLQKVLVNKLDFTVVRQTGSHCRLHGPKGERVTIPLHNKPLALGTLNSILKQSGLDKIEFLKII